MVAESSSPLLPGPLGQPRKQHGKRALATVLREHGVLSPAQAADLVLDICDLLATAHANGVVHGQLGLRGVRLVLTRGDEPSVPRDVDIYTLTDAGDGELEEQATPFLAPEQLALDRPIDARADVWALGALVHTVVVGLAPPAGLPIAADSMPSSLAAIVESCLANDPADRPQDIDELSERIASFATWPPDRFARLSERRDARRSAERARRALEARGLSNMPSVLDKLDEAAVTRAQREGTPTTAMLASILDQPASPAALDRLMAVVHEGTEAARVEHAEGLPALVDFDDEDPIPIIVEQTVPLEMPFQSPLETVPMAMPEPRPVAPSGGSGGVLLMPEGSRVSPLSIAPWARSGRRRPVGMMVAVGLAIVLASAGLGYTGLRMHAASAAAASTMVTPAPQGPTLTSAALPAPSATTAAPATMIPTFAPSALPDMAPVSPRSLPDAKH